MAQLLSDSVEFLRARDDVDPERLGLTGFCAGGRYTMLFLPQMEDFAAGVAWYGFPYNGDTAPADVLGELTAPMLIIHGTEDNPSPIETIFQYVGELRAADKTFELKVYSGEPHGFMLAGGQLRNDDVAVDAFNQMVSYFTRHLG
jgi:carboxymethylenebutenolidase